MKAVMIETPPLAQWMKAMQSIDERLGRSVRWEGYPERTYQQKSGDHSAQLARLAIVLFDYERRHNGAQPLNQYAILCRCLLHDVGEGLLGDMTYRFKAHPLVKELIRHLEEEATARFLDTVPCGEILKAAAFLPTDSGEAAFFDALERLDYVLYALREVTDGHQEFLAVFQRQHAFILNYAEQFPGVKAFYSQLTPFIEEQLTLKAEYLEDIKAAVPQITEQDLLVLTRHFQKLVEQYGLPAQVVKGLVATLQAAKRGGGSH